MVETYEAPLVIADKFGRRFINREKLGENFFVLRMNDYPLTVAASGTGFSGFSPAEDAGHAGDFEIAGFAGWGTAPFRIEISEVGVEANAFMNNPVHSSMAFGMAGLPLILAETIFVLAGKLLQVRIVNLSTSLANAVRLVAIGRKFNSEMSPEVRERRCEFLASRPTRAFWLTTDTVPTTLAAGATNTEVFMTVPSGSHFVAETLLAESTGPFELAIFDGVNGRQLTFGGGATGFVDSRIITGTGQIPARMLGSPLVQPRRSMRILLNDLANSGNNVIHLAMHGRRLRMPVG